MEVCIGLIYTILVSSSVRPRLEVSLPCAGHPHVLRRVQYRQVPYVRGDVYYRFVADDAW